MKLHIKNMVCLRCELWVKQIFRDLEIPIKYVRLGEVELLREISEVEFNQINKKLLEAGFELIVDLNSQLIEQIKLEVYSWVNSEENKSDPNFTIQLSSRLKRDYSYLSHTFSLGMHETLKHYIIRLRIERVKRLILQNELNFSEISFELNYSSLAHLSKQFKLIEGMTPSEYKLEVLPHK
jgi:AraC family transcriptional regulator